MMIDEDLVLMRCHCGHTKQEHVDGDGFCDICVECLDFHEYTPGIAFTCEIRNYR
jgi:hypothetical protein